MNDSLFWKNMEIMRKYKDIKVLTTKARRSYLVSEVFWWMEMKRTKIFINKSVYLSSSIKETSEIVVHEILFD